MGNGSSRLILLILLILTIMAEKVLGKAFVMTHNGKPFGCATDLVLTISTSSSETTGCRDDVVVNAGGNTGLTPTFTIPTGYSWSLTPGALFRFPETAAEAVTMVTIADLQVAQIAGGTLPFTFSLTKPNGYKLTYSGNISITESTLNAPLEGFADGSFTFAGVGALVIVSTPPTT